VEQSSEAHAQPPARRGIPTAPLLIALLAIALWLRLLGPSGHGFDWGDGQFTHPDELYVGNVISSLSFGGPGDLFNSDSAWNPAVAAHLNDPPFNGHPVHGRDGFNYGSLPLYLVFIFQHLLQWLARFVPWWSQWKITPPILAGRMLSAIFDTITVFLVYVIGSRLAGRWTGLLAATLATFAALSIQLSHFTTVDTILTTFATGCVLACIDLLTHGRWRDYALVGVWLAASLATKASGVALLLLVSYTVLWRLSRELRLDWLSAAIRPRYLWQRAVLEGLLTPTAIRRVALLVATFMAALFLFQPYTFSDFTTVVSGIQYQSDLASGKQLIFYTLKWHGTEPLSYPLTQLTFYSIGLPLALLAYAGVVYEWLRMLTPRRNAGFLVALFVVSYFVAAGLLYMKYLRYMEPIIPSLCVLAALFAVSLVRNRAWIGARQLRALGWLAGGAVLALTVLYGVAYEHIYSKPLTRVQSTCWIGKHIAPGSLIAQDGPDETQPLDSCGALFANYRPAGDMALYDPDSPAKVQTMAAVLAHAQYYIISSRRAIETFDNDAADFPYTHRFYQLLFAAKLHVQGPLGYTLVASFAEHPQLGPWTFEDYGSNQNFNEYDHPPVWIFQNTGMQPAEQLAQAITGSVLPPPPAGGYGQQVTVPAPKSLLLSAKDLTANRRGPGYAKMFPADGLPMRLPIVVWLLMVELLGLLALPISMRLFGRLRDCGFVIAKTVGILLLSWLAWILPSLHLAEYGRGEIALCLLPLAAVSLAWGVRPRDVAGILGPRLMPVLLTEVVFLVGYGAFVWIRMLYPDMWHFISGGEKAMDFSFLNAIVRSRTMPPYDPWFSGGTLNYYYYGHFTVATLLKLGGIAPVVAINLAIPTFFALALATCVSIGYNLADRIPWALLAGLFAMICGNLYGARVLVGDLQAASPLHDQLAPVSSADSGIFLIGGIIDTLSFAWSLLHGFVQGTIAALTGLWQVVFHHATLPGYAFGEGWPWDGSRVIDANHVITEWPFWTFLFADPHAHMWDIPFALCILALAFNAVYQGAPAAELARTERAGGVAEVADSRALLPGGRFAIFPVMGAIIGAVGPTNPWDLATMLGAVAIATLSGQLLRGSGWARTLLAVGWRIPLLLVLSLGMYLPFYTHFQSFYSHIGWTITRHQTPVEDFLTHFGFLLFIIVSYLCYALLATTNAGIWLRTVTRAALFSAYYWDRRESLDRYFGLARRAGGGGPIRSVYRSRLETPYLRPVLLIGALLALLALIFGQHWASGLLVAVEAVAIALLLAQPAPDERRATFPNTPALWVLGALGLVALICAVLGYYTPSLLAALGVVPAFLLVFYRPGLRVRRARVALPPLAGALLTVGGCIVLFFLVINYWVLALLTALLTVALIVLVDQRERQDGAQVFLHLLILIGLGVAAAGEIVYIRDFNDADPLTFRNNTVFKIYEQVWLMLGIAGGVSLARLLGPLLHAAPRRAVGARAAGTVREAPPGRSRAATGGVASSGGGPSGWVWGWLIVGLVLFVGAAYYPLRIVPLRVQERQIWPAVAAAPIPATLDSSAFLDYAYPGDYQAIRWINEHIAGSPVMLQSRFGNYRNFSAGITMFTGLPSVVNWGFEAAQQRYSGQPVNPDDPTKVYPSQVSPREADVDTIYSTLDPQQALALLRSYHVGYIYVGLQERGDPTLLGDSGAFHGYPAEGLAKFPLMAAQGSLKLVYTMAEVQIYRVLAAGSGAGSAG